MKPDTSKKALPERGESSPPASVARYAEALPTAHAAICRVLQQEIQRSLLKATSKLWHAMPVWFVGENPVVGYKATAKHVNVLFWNGQSFGDSTLRPVGKFKAAQIQFSEVGEMNLKSLRGWLRKCGTEIWDYHCHFKAHRASRSKQKTS